MIGQWTHQWLLDNHFTSKYYPSTTSTNSIAKEMATLESSDFVCYVADDQTLGRGQSNRTWLNSTPGTNLLLTISLRSLQPPQPELCLTVGNQLHQCCTRLWPQLQWRVKPPNDLYLEEKKVAGILLESLSQGSSHRLLIGLGFNILDFPLNSDFEATCLQKFLPQAITNKEWSEFLHLLIKKIQTII